MADVAREPTSRQPGSPSFDADDGARRLFLDLFSNLASLRDSLTRIYGPAGLSEHRYAVLERLSVQDPEPSRPSRLARETGVTRSAMTEVLDRLDASGWIVRQRDPTDRRTIRIGLTAEGRTVAAAARSHFQVLCHELLREVDARELRRLAELCDTLSRVGRSLERRTPVFRPDPP